MKNCCIIAEFNPFHEGHKYLIDRAKAELQFDNLIVIMSGNYVQRGECAVFDKNVRAKIAIDCGVDIVIELPPYYAVNNANNFARYACKLIEKLPNIDYLVFGCEIDDLNLIKKLSKLSDKFTNESNNSYIKSRSNLFAKILHKDISLFNQSNLILAIEYLKYIPHSVIPYPIKRIGSNYNDLALSAYSSATGLRKLFKENHNYKSDELSVNYLFTDAKFMNQYFNIIIHNYNFLENPTAIDNRIIKAINSSNDYDDLIEKAYAKNISRSTIRRTILRKILKLDNFIIDDIYFNILDYNDNGKKLLSYMDNPIIRTNDIKKSSSQIQKLYFHHKKIDELYYKL